MVGCVLSQLKPSEFYILSCEKGLGLRPWPFPQLRMYKDLILWYVELLGLYRNPECVCDTSHHY